MKLSIVIPAHNEEENISNLIDQIQGYGLGIDFELVIVADHCSDRTAEIVSQKIKKFNNLRLVENKLEAGFANALRTGFSNAYGDLILPIMGDLCDELETIKKMYEKISQGYDVVCGSRYMKGGKRQGGSSLKSFLSRTGGRSLHFILSVPTHDIANSFKMYRKEVIKAVNIEARGFEISMELPLKAYYLGYKITEVPTVWREREKGKSSFKIFKLLPNYLKLYGWAIYKSLTNRRDNVKK